MSGNRIENILIFGGGVPVWWLAACVLLLAVTACADAAPAQVWVTTANRHRLLSREADLKFGSQDLLETVIDVDPTRRYQAIVGFGAAVTDSSAWLISTKLNAKQRAALLQELFGRRQGGIGLSFTRISIGASDFSLRHYSLDDPPGGRPDPDLAYFSIDPHRPHLLPVLRASLAINPNLHIVASPWSPPGWMKDSGSMVHGRLLPQFQPALAAYLTRFVDAYAAEGVPIRSLTIQNEPNFDPPDYPGLVLSPQERARIIGKFLGPMLAKRSSPPQILEWDHNWDLPSQPLDVLADPVASRYIAGVAWHCYNGDVSAQTPVHNAHPDKDAYETECSGGEWDPSWESSMRWFVGSLIIGSTRGWSRGVLLWNLALDEHHGPHTGGCSDCRGVVTINSKTGAVTRNVEYYALAHASRFVRPGAHRIKSATDIRGIETVAFQNTDDKSIALIVLNAANASRDFSVRSAGQAINYKLPRGAVATFVWKPQPQS